MSRQRPALALLLSITCGCVPLRPFADVQREAPAAHFLEADGGLVYVEQAGEGEPVFLLHGFAESTYTWRKVLPGLAATHRVVALDLYGFGYTRRPQDPARYRRDGQVALLLAVMDRLGFERAHLVGHSYGGAICLALAARHPERVRSLVLVASAAPSYPDDRRSRTAGIRLLNDLYLRALALRPRAVERALRRSFHDDALVTPELVAAYLERLRIEGVTDAYYGLSAPSAARAAPVDLARLDVPTLLLWGAQDVVTPVANGRELARRLPRAELVVLAGAGHLPMEERPEELVRAVRTFLARTPAP
ncbi:MAG TPA: alpha/beta fold hydrolase [Thermoanaerobaculia bacterium]|nr:alpha/beta fold hydrolase [Thermoanaerobaculia bacterium]